MPSLSYTNKAILKKLLCGWIIVPIKKLTTQTLLLTWTFLNRINILELTLTFIYNLYTICIRNLFDLLPPINKKKNKRFAEHTLLFFFKILMTKTTKGLYRLLYITSPKNQPTLKALDYLGENISISEGLLFKK